MNNKNIKLPKFTGVVSYTVIAIILSFFSHLKFWQELTVIILAAIFLVSYFWMAKVKSHDDIKKLPNIILLVSGIGMGVILIYSYYSNLQFWLGQRGFSSTVFQIIVFVLLAAYLYYQGILVQKHKK